MFTLPDQLSLLALQNRRLVYGLLFKAASETSLEIAADPRHLGAAIGFLAVLHTWGQTLQHHPHLHCVVPGGGLSPDHSKWIACRKGFFLPVRVLSRLFRGKFVAGLRQMFDSGKLRCPGPLAQESQFERLLKELSRIEWVVYAKPPFGGPEQVLKYLARYTHRVAISNHRLLELKDGRVSFSYKDYAADNVTRTMTLDAVEFTRRFLLHVLPSGFVRIRNYGFLANRCRREMLDLCRRLLATASAQPVTGDATKFEGEAEVQTEAVVCPECRQGRMVIVSRLAPLDLGSLWPVTFVYGADTS